MAWLLVHFVVLPLVILGLSACIAFLSHLNAARREPPPPVWFPPAQPVVFLATSDLRLEQRVEAIEQRLSGGLE